MIFMIAGYGLFGMFANIALIVNIALIFAVLSLIGATLTLPGHRRHRADHRHRRGRQRAHQRAHTRRDTRRKVALSRRWMRGIRARSLPSSTLNVTTLIAVLVLFWLGSGPVRRLRRDPDHRHSRLDVHGRHRHAPHGLLLAALDAAAAHTDLGKRRCSAASIYFA